MNHSLMPQKVRYTHFLCLIVLEVRHNSNVWSDFTSKPRSQLNSLVSHYAAKTLTFLKLLKTKKPATASTFVYLDAKCADLLCQHFAPIYVFISLLVPELFTLLPKIPKHSILLIAISNQVQSKENSISSRLIPILLFQHQPLLSYRRFKIVHK